MRANCGGVTARLFGELGIDLDTDDPQALVLFPEIDVHAEVPEITTACWDILGVDPNDMMCASSRMVVKHKGDAVPAVMACTLLAYESNLTWAEALPTLARRLP